MENKKLIMLFALGFSLIFSIIYYVLFSTISNPVNEKRTIYMNQVGLYKQQDSIRDMQDKLKKDDIITYTWKQDDLIAVVCGVSGDEAETKKLQVTLKKLKYSYIPKSVTVSNTDVIKFIDQKNYAKALERITK